jgi:nicotinamidase-related amidase
MGRLLIDGEPGTDFVAALMPLPGETVIAKPGKGAFYATPLDEALRAAKVRQLVFAGVTTEVCVQTTMREANDRGYECLLAEDATESYFAEFKRAAIDMICAQGGIVGWAAMTDEILAAATPPGAP